MADLLWLKRLGNYEVVRREIPRPAGKLYYLNDSLTAGPAGCHPSELELQLHESPDRVSAVVGARRPVGLDEQSFRYASDVPAKAKKPAPRTATSRRLVREIAYHHRDEVEAPAQKAAKKRTSKSEIIGRALRTYLGVED